QLRQPAPGIQNIGMIGSLNASQMRPGAVSGSQQPRPGLPSSATPSSSGSQMPGSQKTPMHSLTRPMSMGSPATALQQTPANMSSPFRPQQRPQVPQQRPQVPQPRPQVPQP
uniref:Uncharacterized protein n=7 Tax=Aegilops tauschii TaxID=37682 RepID=A0A453FZ38_AEGTS